MNEKVIHIINFVRGVEPRLEMDLHTPVAEELKLAKEYHLPTTWLLQYDALLDPFYVDLLKKEMPQDHEIGVWFEVVQPQVEACGLTWRGRYPWDWHTHVGFSVGYTPREREMLADELMKKFYEVFGFYPKSMGSWLFDAHLLQYLQEKYHITGACNCKDQWGTDGYTLWGGYWANAYYPSKKNAYLPAQSEAMQIPVPVFRMLGSDPIYQYDADPNTPNGQPVVTLEPVYTGYEEAAAGGGAPGWVDWFLRENFRDPVMALGYAQAGQENSFGWEKIGPGLRYQYPAIAKLRDAGAIRVETLHETAERFAAEYALTPVSSVCALSDWRKEGKRASVWYLSRFGRVNFLRENDESLAIRDWQMFDENDAEPFLETTCPTPACTYEAFPVCDGMRDHARIRLCNADGTPFCGTFSNCSAASDAETLLLTATGKNGGSVKILARNLDLRFDCAVGTVVGLEFVRQAPVLTGTTWSLRSETELVVERAGKVAVIRAENAKFEAISPCCFHLLPCVCAEGKCAPSWFALSAEFQK